MEHLTHSAAETEALGCRLGCALTPGTVVAYRGGLGMGTTGALAENYVLKKTE